MDIKIIPYRTPYPAKGSQLLKEFTNTGTPILDSLVRECVQNSLDASCLPLTPVKMSFSTGDCEKQRLFSFFPQLKDMLKQKFPDIPSHFISFRDCNTTGLTGEVIDMCDQNTGNYFKLVLDIGNEQTNAGAGGSCGVGKSLYFRLGVKGLVIYYSRIKLDSGKYESRLISVMVENEREANWVIPPAKKGESKTGIVYWGRLKDENIYPITDETEISSFLSLFNIKPYQNTETGTTIILPFIDETKLLRDNQKNFEINKSTIQPSWRTSIEDFIRMSLQRWYFARLNNSKYKYGNYLKVEINGIPFSGDDMAPCFKVFQALYNRAAGCKEETLRDILSNNKNVKTEEILLPRYKPLKNKKAGMLSYINADKELLNMLPPENYFMPHIYCDKDIEDSDSYTPIIGYCRKPGMIVNYETNGDWLNKVTNTDDEHFLLAIFVLNSHNVFEGHEDLEEYVRKMEPDNHMSWVDSTYFGENYSIIKSIKRNVSSILLNFVSGDKKNETLRNISELGKMFSWILPPEDFGKRPTPKPRPGGGDKPPKPRKSHKKFKYDILSQNLSAKEVDVTYMFETVKEAKKLGMELVVTASDGKNITLDDWHSMGADIPFYLKGAQLSIKNFDGKSSSKFYPLTLNKPIFEDEQLGLQMQIVTTEESDFPYAFNIQFKTEHMFKIEIRLEISISSRKALPTINII